MHLGDARFDLGETPAATGLTQNPRAFRAAYPDPAAAWADEDTLVRTAPRLADTDDATEIIPREPLERRRPAPTDPLAFGGGVAIGLAVALGAGLWLWSTLGG
jgi:ferric-dicitrate binding protein FerR (iron transport regulator)